MAHSRRFARPIRSSRRTTLWNEGPFSQAIQSVTAAGLTIIGTGQSAFGSTTIVRIRGEFVMWLEVVTAIGDGFTRGAVGIGIVTADAFGIGGTAMPSPGSNADWGGWMWYQSFGPLVGLSVTEADNSGRLSMVRFPIDTKAMRKMQPNEVLFGALSLSTEIGAATVSFGMNTRMLVKLA